MRYDLTTLKIFLAVADESNIARAAERENIVASAVSKRISDFEKDLNCPLFVRHRGGVTLTPAGQALVTHAKSIFALTDRVTSELSIFSSGAKGHVRLAANPSSITQFLGPPLARFVKVYPDIRVELLEQTSDRIVQLVADRVVDLGIIAGSVDFKGLETIDFAHDSLAMMVPQRHPIARRRRVAFAETLDFDQVGLAEGSSIQATLFEAARKVGRTLDLKVRVASFDALRRLVEAGIGIACLPLGCIRPYASTHGLRAIPLTDDWADRQLKICVREQSTCSAPAKRFLAMLSGS